MKREHLFALGGIFALLMLASRRASAAALPRAEAGDGMQVSYPDGSAMWPAPEGWQSAEDYFDPVYDAPTDESDPWGVGLPVIHPWEFPASEVIDMGDQNMKAFLYAIRSSEHAAADVASGIDYFTFYGGSRFVGTADHPVITGEKAGVKLTPAQCRAAGFPSGNCVSTAAGAYQIIRPTWEKYRAQSPRLPDFSPASQDEAAIRILRDIGAERLIRAGDFAGAVARASRQWASLPGSTSGQPQRSMDFVTSRYVEAGGVA